jgi:uncharacterized protein (DUF4213/DUF364 family)
MRRSKLIDDLIAAAAGGNEQVRDVRVGVSWTAVYGKYCGLAKTYGIPVKHGNYTRNMGNLMKMTTLELAEYAQSWNLIEASIGCAAISAMVAPKPDCADINVQEIVLEKGAGARVVVAGAFPFSSKLKKVAKQVYILELDPYLLDSRQGILPESAANYLIPDCDLFIMTGSTLINKSMEHLLQLPGQAKPIPSSSDQARSCPKCFSTTVPICWEGQW